MRHTRIAMIDSGRRSLKTQGNGHAEVVCYVRPKTTRVPCSSGTREQHHLTNNKDMLIKGVPASVRSSVVPILYRTVLMVGEVISSGGNRSPQVDTVTVTRSKVIKADREVYAQRIVEYSVTEGKIDG